MRRRVKSLQDELEPRFRGKSPAKNQDRPFRDPRVSRILITSPILTGTATIQDARRPDAEFSQGFILL